MSKFSNVIINNTDIKVNTPYGFESFIGIQKIQKNEYWHIITDRGLQLKCSMKHPIKKWKSNFVYACTLIIGDLIETNKGSDTICYSEFVNEPIELYDLLNVGQHQELYTNDILSHNCEFLGSSNTLIHPSVLSKLVYMRAIDNPHEVKIYKHPIKDHIYTITVDVSEGLGMDSSALVVVDCSTVPYEVVATFKDANISQLMLPTLLSNIGKYYNEAAILVEINIGSQVVNILHQDLEYENIVMTKMSGKKGTAIGISGNQNRLGIKTTQVTKRIGCANLKTLIESDKIILNDYDIINELSTYAVDRNTYNAEEGHHDDLVMCMVLFAWMASQNYFKDVSNTDIRKRIEEEVEEDFTPFGIIHDGREEEFNDKVMSENEFEKFLLN